MPFLSFDVYPAPAPTSVSGTGGSATLAPRRRDGGSDDGEDEVRKKGWLTYVPLGVLLFIVFVPQPSYLITLSSFYLKTRHAPWRFGVHLLAVEALTLGALSSLVVCVVRDPGGVGRERDGARNNRKNEARVGARQKKKTTRPRERIADAEDGVTSSLLWGGGESYDEGDVHDAEREDAEDVYDVHDGDLGAAEDGEGDAVSSFRANPGVDTDMDPAMDGRWCGRCNHARPERAHHCASCGRCVLKMDHHCPWLGGNCVGHRTYPAFVHFLLMSTLLAAYIMCVSLSVVVYLVTDPFSIDPHASPLHALVLLFVGAAFTLTMGSFLLYHVYLVSTNQTTLEHMSPFLLLRYIPPPPPLETAETYDIPPYTPYGSREPLTHADVTGAGPLVDTSTHAAPELQMRAQLVDDNAPAADTTVRPYRPPDEHDLSPAQRRVVQHVHGQVRMYDLGWRRNWGEVFGGGLQSRGYWVWVGEMVLCGGWPRGDGRRFERGRGARKGVERLVKGLEDVGRTEGRGWRWGGDT